MKERIRNGHEARQALDELVALERDERFRQLLDLAKDGDPDAPGDLLREFNFNCGLCVA